MNGGKTVAIIRIAFFLVLVLLAILVLIDS